MASQPVISMRQAVRALNLRVWGPDSEPVSIDGEQANIRCPACADSHSSGRLTMNINFDKNTFACARCGFKGGVHHLIAYYTGWEMKDVAKKVKAGELDSFTGSEVDGNKISSTLSAEETSTRSVQLASLRQRDQVYRAMLERLSLSDMHRKDLLKRGLSDKQIEAIGFRSISQFADRKAVPKKLISAGYDLRGVPGFGIEDGTWVMARQKDSGFLVPLKNGSGLIQGFQIRYDHASDSLGKYGYFTSAMKDMEDGVKASVWSSWAGDDVDTERKPFDIIITEGALKGYIINARTGVNVLSVPGVNALTKLVPALESMKLRGLKGVFIAYDMDLFENKAVEKALMTLMENLESNNLPYKILVWDKGKGLDDWLVENTAKRI